MLDTELLIQVYCFKFFSCPNYEPSHLSLTHPLTGRALLLHGEVVSAQRTQAVSIPSILCCLSFLFSFYFTSSLWFLNSTSLYLYSLGGYEFQLSRVRINTFNKLKSIKALKEGKLDYI